jgi:hypothetical protein
MKTVDDLLKELRDKSFYSDEHAHIRYFFRGQADITWKLEPGVYRDTFKFAVEAGGDEEAARLLTERHLAQDFRVMSRGLRTGREDNVDLYFLQQHYGMPTRLLDWSNNPMAALYFAVMDKNKDGIDGAFFAMDAYNLPFSQSVKKDTGEHRAIQGIAISDRDHLKRAVNVITSWSNKSQFGKYVFAVRPDHFDKRMSLQRSCFTFHVPERPRLDPGEYRSCLRAFTVAASAKAAIRSELARLGIDDFSVYGDLDHLASRLKAAYLK